MSRLPDTLDGWLEFIDATHPSQIALGLERVRTVAEGLGVLRPGRRNLIVAGTNGKGSTCMFAEALLEIEGQRTGTTLSPHLERFNERIRLGGEAVDDDAICGAMARVEAARAGVELTYFEYVILAALTLFSEARVDVAILEVGLGGRLDAVNVVDADVAVITSIGLDHQDYLGDDLETIGAEKAGILRPDIPLVFGSGPLPASIAARADELGVRVERCGVEFELSDAADGWRLDGAGPYPRPAVALVNAATALRAVTLLEGKPPSPRTIAEAAARVRLAGRFERFDQGGRSVILDVAHNPAAAEFLAGQLAQEPCAGTTRALAGFLQDKDVAGIVRALEDQIQDWTFVGTGTHRGQSGADTLCRAGALFSQASPMKATDIDPAAALERLVTTLNPDDRLVVLGSFDVVQHARRYLSNPMATRNTAP